MTKHQEGVRSRQDVERFLADRDGPDCFLCKKPFKINEEITLDHWIPQSYGKQNGWSEDRIWALSNLRLAHKPCNAKKGDMVPIDDVTVPQRAVKDSVPRAVKRADRPSVCLKCQSGRQLGPGEICDSCGSGPMPEAYPNWAKMKPNECDHELFWCWLCSIGIIQRPAAIITVLDGQYLDE